MTPSFNGYIQSTSRTIRSMEEVSSDARLTQHQRLLARQCRNLAAALFRTFEDSSHG